MPFRPQSGGDMHAQQITIRQAGSEDVERLAELRWHFQTEDLPDNDRPDKRAFLDSCAAALAQQGSDGTLHHWFAEIDGQAVAVMSVRKVFGVPSPHGGNAGWGYLTNCYTLPSHRTRGRGGRLLAAIEIWARSEGLELLIVWPSDDAYDFYRRAGFARNADPLVLTLAEAERL